MKRKATRKEVMILNLMKEDQPVKQVADACNNSIDTIRTHIRNLKVKFNVSTDHGLIYRALKDNIINEP